MEDFLVKELSQDLIEQLLNKLDPGYEKQPNGLYHLTLEGMDFLLEYSKFSLTCRKMMFTACSPQEVNEWNGQVNLGSCHVEPDGVVMFKATHVTLGGSSLLAIANYLSSVKITLKDFYSKFPYVENESTYFKSVVRELSDKDMDKMLDVMPGISHKYSDGVYYIKYPIDPENTDHGYLLAYSRINKESGSIDISTYLEPGIFKTLGVLEELRQATHRINRWNTCTRFCRACITEDSEFRLSKDLTFSHGTTRETIFRELHGFLDVLCPDFVSYMITGEKMFGPPI